MMKNGLLVLMIVLLFLAGCEDGSKVFVCPDGTEAESSDLCTSEKERPCIEEGKTGAVIPGNECCNGLDALNPTTPEQNCQELVGAFLCANCGDGLCKTGENKCNCPADCKDLTLEGTNTANEYTFKTIGESAFIDNMKFTLLIHEKDGESTFDIDGEQLILNNVNEPEIFKNNKRVVIKNRYWTAKVGEESHITVKVEPFALKENEYLLHVGDKVTVAGETIEVADVEYVDQEGVGFDYNGDRDYKKVILGMTKQIGNLQVTVVEIFPNYDIQENRYTLIKVTTV